MEQEQENYEFTDDQRAEILQETFKVGHDKDECEDKSLEDIIDSVIDAIKDDGDKKDCIKKYWFTKQIEEWKEQNKADKEPSDDELMDIVREDLKIRMENTMLELRKQNIDKKDIWFYQSGEYVVLHHNDDEICEVLGFNYVNQHSSTPYKPFL